MKVLGRTREYHRNKNKGLRSFRCRELVHIISWPIDLSRRNFQLASYFGERNYSNPSFRSHPGIDIQVLPGTPVVTPEISRLVSVDKDTLRNSSKIPFWMEFNLGAIKMFGMETGLLYTFGHLSWDSIREDMKSLHPLHVNYLDLNGDLDLRFGRGEFIGRVGLWPYTLGSKVKVSSDVHRSFKRGYSHLHFETASYDFDDSPTFIIPENFTQFNPLLVLQDLDVPR